LSFFINFKTLSMRKKITILALFLLSQFALAQNIISKSGTITFTNANKMEYIDLEENGNVFTFIEKKSNQKFNYPKNTIFKIVDENGVEIDLLKLNRVETKPVTIIESIDNSKNYVESLEFKGINNIFLNDKKLNPEEIRSKMSLNSIALEQYNKGKKLSSSGNVILGVGLGLILFRVWEVYEQTQNNQLFINENYSQSDESRRAKLIIISGLVLSATGIILKISGKSNIKKSVSTYNSTLATANYFKPEYSIKVNGNGLGLAVSF
jgi:hypothetical protein